LIWSDEFDSKGLPDPKKWDYEEGFIRNEEDQVYTRGRKEDEGGFDVEIDVVSLESDKARACSGRLLPPEDRF